jgi:hypothetical protein
MSATETLETRPGVTVICLPLPDRIIDEIVLA